MNKNFYFCLFSASSDVSDTDVMEVEDEDDETEQSEEEEPEPSQKDSSKIKEEAEAEIKKLRQLLAKRSKAAGSQFARRVEEQLRHQVIPPSIEIDEENRHLWDGEANPASKETKKALQKAADMEAQIAFQKRRSEEIDRVEATSSNGRELDLEAQIAYQKRRCEEADREEAKLAKKSKVDTESEVKSGEGEEDKVIDFSQAGKPNDGKYFFNLGEGYAISCDLVTFNAGNQHSSYEAVSVIKTVQPGKDAKVNVPRDVQINMPLRNLKTLCQSLADIEEKMHSMHPLPSVPELDALVAKEKGRVDLSQHADRIPKITYKIDELLTLKGERVTWGKASVEVLNFKRANKDKSKNDFSLQLPARLFNSLKLAIDYIAKAKNVGL